MLVFPEQFTSLTHHFSCSVEYELHVHVPCGANQSRDEHAHFKPCANTVTIHVYTCFTPSYLSISFEHQYGKFR